MTMYEKIVDQIKARHFNKALNLISAELQMHPEDVYLLTQQANVLWNLGRAEEALQIAERASEMNTCYPLLIYTKGRILSSLERYDAAAKEWECLITGDVDEMAEMGFGKRWALSVKNDARFYKAECLYHLYCDKEALSLMEQHVANRRKGLESDFTMREAREFLRMLRYSKRGKTLPDDDDTYGYLKASQAKRIVKKMETLENERLMKRLIGYLKRKCREFPKEYWLKTCLSEYLFSLEDKSCLLYAKDAYEMAPDDMLVVYNYASALFLNGKYQEAEKALDVILQEEINFIAYGEHGEGLRWAKQLIKDSRKLQSKIHQRK